MSRLRTHLCLAGFALALAAPPVATAATPAGELTPDGRFRVVAYEPAPPTYPGYPTYPEVGADIAYDVQTLQSHVIRLHYPSALGRPIWRNDCGDRARNPAGSLVGALTGPKPACRFARSTGDGNAPGDGDWASPATVSALLGGTPTAAQIDAARWSPDRSRLVFRVLGSASWPSVGEAHTEDPISGDLWTVRADGTQLHQLTRTVDAPDFAAFNARWLDDDELDVEVGSVAGGGHGTHQVATVRGSDCWSVTTTTPGPENAVRVNEACESDDPAPPTSPGPSGDGEQPATQQPSGGQPAATAPVTKPQAATTTKPGPTVRILALGKKLGGKKRNLLSVKFVAPAGVGVKLTLLLPAAGGKGEATVLATATLTPAQAATGVVRLKLNARARKLLKASDRRVTVRTSPVKPG